MATGVNIAGSRPRQHRGVSIVYVGVSMMVLLGFCSLAVDLGRAQTAKTELERACDAAARAGAANLSNGVSAVQAAAAAYAQDNLVDGKPLVIDSNNDVIFLAWPSTTPLVGAARSSANSVEVSTSQVVPLVFAQVLGKPTVTVHATSIASASSSAANFQVAGISGFTLGGNNTIDSYNSANGPYMNQTPGNKGSVASNVEVSVPYNSTIDGNVYYFTAPGGAKTHLKTEDDDGD